MSYQVELRIDTSANWVSANTVLGQGEFGLDTTLRRMKLGDGSTGWNALPWFTDDPTLVFPPSSGWSAFNSGSVTADAYGRINTLTAASGDNWKGELRTLSPTSNYTATFYFDWITPPVNYSQMGLILKNSGTATFLTFGIIYNSGFSLSSIKWNSTTSASATYLGNTIGALTNGIPNWLRIRDNATTRFYEYSYNGVDWVLHFSVGRTDFVTPDQIGWGVSANNTGGAYTSALRLRHFAIT